MSTMIELALKDIRLLRDKEMADMTLRISFHGQTVGK
jgi:hypothetical protein